MPKVFGCDLAKNLTAITPKNYTANQIEWQLPLISDVKGVIANRN